MSIPEPPKDKRTKEFKAWKEKYESAAEGAGDVIESITTATGIKAAVEFVAEAFDASCGCDERKKKLNNILRFKPKNCLNEEEFNLTHKPIILNENVANSIHRKLLYFEGTFFTVII